MNILLTGTNTYLGKHLQSKLLGQNHRVTALVRRSQALRLPPETEQNLSILYGDIIRESYSASFPDNLQAAYYFSNYPAEQGGIYKDMELLSISNFVKKLRRVHCQHLIYVSSLRSPVNEDVESMLSASYIPYTLIRTSNIVGKDSALLKIFEEYASQLAIISNHQLSKSKAQPIAVSDALAYLEFIGGNPESFHQKLDIGGPEILTYKEMITQYLQSKGIKKKVISLPFVHEAISAFWLRKSGGISREMAKAFQRNVKGDVLCSNNRIKDLFPRKCLTFKQALSLTQLEI